MSRLSYFPRYVRMLQEANSSYPEPPGVGLDARQFKAHAMDNSDWENWASIDLIGQRAHTCVQRTSLAR